MADPINVLSLCSGAGGLDLGFREVFPSRVVAYVEREGYAAANLAANMAEGRLDPAPIWTDLQSFDAAAFHGKVDCVTAGFPCPPVSVAGARKGVEDERWLWPDVWRVVRETGAWIVALENVSGLISSRDAFESILGDLAEGGFTAEWLCLQAKAVGAGHRRERWFCLAYSEGVGEREQDDTERSESRRYPWVDARRRGRQLDHAASPRHGSGRPETSGALRDEARRAKSDGRRGSVDDPANTGRRPLGIGGDGTSQRIDREREGDSRAGVTGALVADSVRPSGGQWAGHLQLADAGRQRDEQRRESGDLRRETGEAESPAHERQRDGRTDSDSRPAVFAPGPGSPEWPRIVQADPFKIPAHSYRFIWQQALQECREAGALTATQDDRRPGPADGRMVWTRAAKRLVRRVANGLARRFDRDRPQRLRLGGNGVVPQQAAAAFRELHERHLARAERSEGSRTLLRGQMKTEIEHQEEA